MPVKFGMDYLLMIVINWKRFSWKPLELSLDYHCTPVGNHFMLKQDGNLCLKEGSAENSIYSIKFLSDIVSPFRRNNDRNLRNSRDYVVPRFRLSSTLNSFFPSSIKLWDDLTYELRHNCTQNQFKYALKCMREVTKVPFHYNIGDRKGNV